MSRGFLSKEEQEEVNAQLPDLTELWELVNSLSPEMISMKCPHESDLPVAAVALDDAVDALTQARYALVEVLEHRIWYNLKKAQPDPMSGTWFEAFYLGDAAMRLYAAGEHLANALIMMLEIKEEDLQPHKGQKVSKQSVVARYLHRKRSGHELTIAVDRLGNSACWDQTMTLRGRIVHAQPPLFHGLGIVYKRQRRWEHHPDGGGILRVGMGDEPECTTSATFEYVSSAAHAFRETLLDCVRHYWGLLEPRGIRYVKERKSVNVDLFDGPAAQGDSGIEPTQM